MNAQAQAKTQSIRFVSQYTVVAKIATVSRGANNQPNQNNTLLQAMQMPANNIVKRGKKNIKKMKTIPWFVQKSTIFILRGGFCNYMFYSSVQ